MQQDIFALANLDIASVSEIDNGGARVTLHAGSTLAGSGTCFVPLLSTALVMMIYRTVVHVANGSYEPGSITGTFQRRPLGAFIEHDVSRMFHVTASAARASQQLLTAQGARWLTRSQSVAPHARCSTELAQKYLNTARLSRC